MSSAKTPLTGFALALVALTAACATGPSKEDAELARAMEAALAPASPEERAAANRADPLTRANFWSREYQKDPTDAAVTLEFSDALRGIGSHARAAEVLSTTLVVHPGNTDIMMALGRLHMAGGDHPAALRVFDRAAATSPDRADTWASLGTAFDQLQQHAQAQAAYQRALMLEPQRTTTLTNYGLSLLLSGDLKGAEAQLRTAAANPDANARVHENLALVLGLQGRFEEMKEVSRAAAPASVSEQNAALVRALVQPTRSYEALTNSSADAATEDGGRRQLRRSIN
ncbi:MAG: tetratricopeptide repeat protein [Hyphomonas sp.]